MSDAAISVPTYTQVSDRASAEGLLVMGVVPDPQPIVLLGAGPGFWDGLRSSEEGTDGAPDPVDRWSLRVIANLAGELGAAPRFPFGGPPYEPFIDWALRSGRAWSSPTGMLVHDTVGLMISYRGALVFDRPLADVPTPLAASPCDDCRRPCLAACPVGALGPDHAYDVPACHDYLATEAGQASCMTRGCTVRRSCPVSQGADRSDAQSAYHMKAFHPT
ncbi:ferredoxin [Chachezhania antarctica]|uniref:ferredoxin n=1 Tax=Chachezhania antarctica TaxID=2340860 RepID=UPI000EAC1511|nr:ferredoxin [Chachezhania antarctica]|tara:strand:- start:469 stop:1125 length:657 start_codon:yes stop_codon:yes gene_type:complete